MAQATLANAVTRTDTDAAINGNGTFHLFQSGKVNVNAGDNAVEVVIKYIDNVPNPANNQVAKYNLVAVLETQDDDGTWHPFHAQYSTFVNSEDGNVFTIKLDPKIFVFDVGVTNDISNGLSIVSRESIKQGTLPNDFRVCVLVNEFGYIDGVAGIGSFEQTKLTITYNTYTA